ncbi:MAG TPA: amidohydrolase family protein [Candidatus Acidoferrales bacterium]|jgi:imidazolonepropionase-like amidohydrolase|nr:amidohydrolase family protein [Candidatus Acidoferrales bacterium]
MALSGGIVLLATLGFFFAMRASGQSSPAQQSKASGAFIIRNARIFDGTRVIPRGDVWVEDGKIKAVGADLKAPEGIPAVDGSGGTLLPGLVDSHTHTFTRDHLQAALVFGVTTELDMFTSHQFAQQIKKAQADGKDLGLADLRSAGTLVTAPHGHGTEYGMNIPTITGPEEAQAFVDARIAEGSDYIKIIYDNGSAYGSKMPTISKETMAAVVVAAHNRGKMAVAHIGSLAGARDAIDAGVDGLMHLFVDAPPDPQFGAFVAAHHAFVVPTLSVNESVTGKPSGASLATDPRLEPYLMPDDVAHLKGSFPPLPTKLDLAYAQQAVQQLKAAHVPLLAGTDAPNPGTAHGASIHRELELLVQAGLTPAEALTAATATPARAFHLDDRGRIAPGLRADLLLVKGDPTADITATRDIVSVWKLGVEADRPAYRAAVEKANAARAAAPSGSESGLISDFEDGKATAKYGAGWDISTDSVARGKSSAEMKVTDGGANNSKYSLQVTGNIDGAVPYAWAGAIFFPGNAPFTPVNLSMKKQVRFWAKGDGKTYRVMLFSQSRGFFPATQTFLAAPEWKEYTFTITTFGLDGKDLTALLFSGGPSPGGFSFQIDDVRIE